MVTDRIQAGHLLSEVLKPYRNSKNVIVVAIPYGGLPVALQIAKELSLPLQVIPCKRIKHPGDSRQSIGSVSLTDIVMQNTSLDIPQDFVCSQVRSVKRDLQKQTQVFGDYLASALNHKTIILVDDRLKTGDTMLAGLRSIKRERPAKIIVATPVATTKGLKIIEDETDEIICLHQTPDEQAVSKFFSDFPKVDEETALELLLQD